MHEDLFRQARRLATLDPKRPRQANLRRAVSSAYYAAFHALIDGSCRMVFGGQHQQAPFRQVLGRAFSHSVMKEACRSFLGGTLKASVRKGLPSAFTIPAAVRRMAEAFVELQQIRHLADYDLTERFTRSDVLLLIEQAESALDDFQRLPPSDENTNFLACLWAWGALANR
ncbi:MAG: hypothetical protein IT428_18560 [Planctomycetaceae bacterium]|nr:hypothetical protein [Planctomycetaceae bacterium]